MKDPRVENCLKANQYTFRYVGAYKLERIDMTEADQNPARLTRRYDEDHMLQMACRLEDGVEFPGIVVCDIGGSHDELSTGYHRVKAALFGNVTVFPAYIVAEPDPYRRAILPVLLNTIEGRAPGRIEIYMTIMDLTERFSGTKARDLCKIYGIPEEAFLSWRRLEEISIRARNLGVGSAFSSKVFNQRVRGELGRIANDNTFVGVVDVLSFTKTMQGQSAEEFIKEIRKNGRTEVVAQRMIEERRREFVKEEVQRKQEEVRTPSSISTKYMSRVNGLVKFRRSFSVASLQLAGIPPTKLPASLAAIRSLQGQLDEVADTLEQLVEQHRKEQEWRTSGKASSTSTGAPHSPGISPSA